MATFVRWDNITLVLASILTSSPLLPIIDFGVIEGYDPTGNSLGNWHSTVILTSPALVITTGFINPVKPRTVYIDDQDGLGTGSFIIVGKDALGASLSETVDLSQAHQTTNAFAKITSITCPVVTMGTYHFDFSTGNSVGLQTTSSTPIMGVPTVNGFSQISFGGLESGWGMNISTDATHVSLNKLSLGDPFTLGGDVVFYKLN